MEESIDTTQLPKLTKRTLVDDFIQRFEQLILSGKLQVGEQLPSERDLAARLGVSRPVVHEGLIDLAAKGLVSRSSRGGAVVNDFRKTGSLAMLNSILNYEQGIPGPQLAESLLAFRFLVEVENARLAARNRTEENLREFRELLSEEAALLARASSQEPTEVSSISTLDFRFHHLVSLATGNLFYPLLINSCKPFYIFNVSLFYAVPGMMPVVFDFHTRLVEAITAGDENQSAQIMHSMLEHGQKAYQDLISNPK